MKGGNFMLKKLCFIAGIYGVGKTTLCEKIKNKVGIEFFSASDIISQVNGEMYGKNKLVKNEKRNQEILISKIKKLKDVEKILLNGHFCIFDNNNYVIQLPIDTYSALDIDLIILLERDTKEIVRELIQRDNKKYLFQDIEQLKIKEKEIAIMVSKQLNIPLHIHNMTFDESDENTIISFLEKEGVI